MTEKRNCCNIPQVLDTHCVHTLGHLEIDDLPNSVARGASRTASSVRRTASFICLRAVLVACLLICRTAFDPFTTALLHSMSLGSNINHPQKSPSRAPPPSDFRDTNHWLHGRRLSLAEGQQRCARTRVLCRRLGAITQGAWSFVQKLKKGGVMRAVQVYVFVLFDILS